VVRLVDRLGPIEWAEQSKQLCEGKGGLFDVIEQLQQSVRERSAATGPTDTAEREALYFEHRALEQVASRFRGIIGNGQIAERMRDGPGS